METTSQHRHKNKINQVERYNRINEGMENLRRTVPGLDSAADKATVMQLTAAYVKFIQKTFGSAHHSGFLSEIQM